MSILKAGLVALLGLMAILTPLPAQAPNTSRAIAVKPAPQQSTGLESRVALVIGNGAYQTSPLKNPPNDARAVSGALQRCGFQVQTLVNATLPQMEDALRQFGQRLKSGSVGLFYYAGHGMQVKGSNYLIPVGANIAAEDEVRFKALDASEVLAKMESAGNGLNLMILDACRNDPFGHSWRRGGPAGLAQMDAPTGTYIAFSTAPGKTASDGTGSNGLYTQKFLEALNQPGLSVEQVFKRVRVGVKLASKDEQVPWDSSSLTGDFFFRLGAAPVQPLPSMTPTPATATATATATTPSMNLTEPWKLLIKSDSETGEEFQKRISALPFLPIGKVIPQRDKYDKENHLLPILPKVGSWAASLLPKGLLWVSMDEDMVELMRDEGVAIDLEGRFLVQDDKVQCSELKCVGRSRSYAIGDLASIKWNKGPLVGVTASYHPWWLMADSKGIDIVQNDIANPINNKYSKSYEDINRLAAYKPLEEQINIAKEHEISLLLIVKITSMPLVPLVTDTISFINVKSGKQLMEIKFPRIQLDTSGLLKATEQCLMLIEQ
jgi:uncharacterized caspase-like protein